jgi:glycosyltransferase involved in cell wall biosynthesis
MAEQQPPDTRAPSVLFVIGSMREGGAEGQVLHLMRELRREGWRVAVVLLRWEGVRLQEACDEFEVFRADVPIFRPRLSPLPWLKLPLAWRRSRRFIREWNPDIVHAWLFWAHLWAWMILPRGVPFITSRRQVGSDKGTSPVLMALERLINRRTHLVISNSRVVENECRRREQWPAKQSAQVIYNGIDLATFDAAPTRDLRKEFPALAGATHIAITVANLLPHKGYDTLIDAWELVASRHAGAKVLCVGSDGGILAELHHRLQARGLVDHVHFTGLRRDVPSLLKGADFAVHASHDEGFSNAVLEYMAAGLAVVAADVGGNSEALNGGRCGAVVPARDPKALALAVIKLIDNPERRREAALLARRRAAAEFRLDAMATQYVATYEGILRRDT